MKVKYFMDLFIKKFESTPTSLKILIGLTIFMLTYVRLNINLMPLILIYFLWEYGFYQWLCRIFGEQETKIALKLMLFSAIFFIVIMIFWRVAIVMDIFLNGDGNRVFRDYTSVSSNHYRTNVHPFYVLIWQSFYHMVGPLNTTNSIAIRCIVAIFAGINVGIFSLLFSSISKNIKLNILTRL